MGMAKTIKDGFQTINHSFEPINDGFVIGNDIISGFQNYQRANVRTAGNVERRIGNLRPSLFSGSARRATPTPARRGR